MIEGSIETLTKSSVFPREILSVSPGQGIKSIRVYNQGNNRMNKQRI